MSRQLERALQGMESARPSSGFRPETEAEWRRLQAAQVQLAVASYRLAGVSRTEALRIADLIHGGAAGRLLLEVFFPADPPEDSA